jgi:hypothetical protein
MTHVVDAGGKYQSQSFEDSQAFPSFAASPGVRDGTHQVLAQIVYVIDWAYSTSFLASCHTVLIICSFSMAGGSVCK